MVSAPGVCIISAKENSRLEWVKVGQLAERLMLRCYAQGAKTSIFVASVEMGQLYEQVQQIIGTRDRPQFLFCIGYMNKPQRHTPRHLVENKLILN